MNTLNRPAAKRRLAATAVALLVAGFTLGVADTANAATSGDPLATGCSNGASTIWSTNYLGYGKVEVRYSPSCQTNWVRISGASGRPAEAGISSASSGWKYSPSYQNSPDSFWTPMVYAPGSTCVTFYAKLVNANGAVLNTGYKQLC